MGRKESNQTNKTNLLPANDGISLWNFKTHRIQCMLYFSIIVLQISRLSEGSTGQIFATSSVIYQMKMWGL